MSIGGNLRGAFALRKTKVLLGLVVVLIAGTVAAMALRGGKGPESRLAPAPNVAAVTGGREQAQSPLLDEAIRRDDRRQAAEALEKGQSEVPSIGVLGVRTVAQRPAATAVAPTEPEVRIAATSTPSYASQTQNPQVSEIQQAMLQQMRALMDRAGTQPQPRIFSGKTDDKTASATTNSAAAAQSAGGVANGQAAKQCRPLYSTGDIAYAQLVTSADSRNPTEIVAVLQGGPLDQARLVGSFQQNTNADSVNVRFNLLSLPKKGGSQQISAGIVDLNTARLTYASRVDYQPELYLLRFASKALDAFAESASQADSTVNVVGSSGTVVESRTKPSVSQSLFAAGGAVGKDIAQDMDRRTQQNTTIVYLDAKDEIGVIFLQDVCAKNN